MMEIPKDMKGLEKSITSSRTRVMVNGATAMSAFYKRRRDNHQRRGRARDESSAWTTVVLLSSSCLGAQVFLSPKPAV